MTPGEELLLVVAIVYLVECTYWVERASVPFRARLGRKLVAVEPAHLFGNESRGLLLAMPLPPFGRLVLTRYSPVSVSPESVLAFSSSAYNPGARPPQRGGLRRLDEIGRVTAEGRWVELDGSRFVEVGSTLHARELAAWLRGLAGMASAYRQPAIESEIAASMDVDAARRRLAALESEARLSRWLGTALFAHVFVVCPLLAAEIGLALAWPFLATLLATLLLATLLAFARAHRRLLPEARAERRAALAHMTLSPLGAIRTGDALARDLFCRFHPLAIAAAALPAPELASFAGSVLRDLDHPLAPAAPEQPADAAAVETWFRDRLRREAERVVRAAGLDPVQARRSEMPPGTLAICPRCATPYQVAGGTCGDCGITRVPVPGPGRGTGDV